MSNYYVKSILTKIQDLEEICGPDTIGDYIEILEAVKADIEERLVNAREVKAESTEEYNIWEGWIYE
jgi:hypothetical protein